MKNLFNLIAVLILTLSVVNASTLEDEAFNAYKNKNYTKSVELYKKAAKDNSLKAILMLGLFSEQGIGVTQDKNRAIKFYKYILKRTSNLKGIIKSKDKIKKIDITVAALKRLYLLTKNKKYEQLAKKIEKLKDRDKELEFKPKTEPNNLFKQNSANLINEFLVLCPHAQRVAPEDREGIENFDCDLFENFPDRMALFMKLRRLKFKALKNPKKTADILNILNKKLAKVVQPMIKYLQQESVSCYEQATTNADIKACDYDYLTKSDPLLFDNAAYRMEQAIAKRESKTYQIGTFEKNSLVNKLIDKITNSTYGKPWRHMVKL